MCLPYRASDSSIMGEASLEHGADLSAGLEKAGGLTIDHIEVPRLAGVRIVRIHELQDLALGDRVGRIGHDVHDLHTIESHHHLKGAGVQEIAHQNARGVAKFLVRRLVATAKREDASAIGDR